MGLFKKNHDKTHATHATEAPSVNNDFAPGVSSATGPTTGMVPQSGGYNQTSVPASGAGGVREPGYGNSALGSTNHHNAGMGAGVNDPYPSAGPGHNLAHNQGLPPTSTLNDQRQGRSGGGQRMTGKVEHALGTMVGSNALKAKGLQKEQEANSIKLQGQELAEAERLEQEALLRRERAVAHGAHPENRHPGGVNTSGGPGY